MIFRDRIVLPDNSVITPEEIAVIDVQDDWIRLLTVAGTQGHADWRKVSNARVDRHTGLTDKNGVMIYERDIIGGYVVVFNMNNGSWDARSDNCGILMLAAISRGYEVTGLLSWEESHD